MQAALSHDRRANSSRSIGAKSRGEGPSKKLRNVALQNLKRGNRLPANEKQLMAANARGEVLMAGLKWLAVLPFLAILVGTAFVNTVEPLVFGLPLVLAWLVIWVILTAAIMALIFYSDPANADVRDGDQGAER
jgi:hypothetical protein